MAKVTKGENKVEKADTYNIRPRLLRQVSVLLSQLEAGAHITLRERVQALVAIGRIEQIFVALKKAEPDESNRGATVTKYATAFTDAASRRKTGAGAIRAVPEPDDSWFETDDADTDDSADSA